MKTLWCPKCRAFTEIDTLVATTDGRRTVPEREFCAKCGTYVSKAGSA